MMAVQTQTPPQKPVGPMKSPIFRLFSMKQILLNQSPETDSGSFSSFRLRMVDRNDRTKVPSLYTGSYLGSWSSFLRFPSPCFT